MRVDEVIVKPPTGQVVVATFDEKEVQLVLFEALVEMKHPAHQSVDEALALVERNDPMLAEGLRRAAHAAMRYVVDRLNAAEPDLGVPTQGPMQ